MRVKARLWFTGMLALALVLMVPFGLRAQTPKSSKPDKISVVYCEDCVPFQFTDQTGNPAGIIIDFWKLWAEKTGIKVNFRAAPWDETLALMRERKVDAHAGLFYNEERDRYLEYGLPLTKTDTHFFIHRDLPPAKNITDLAAYRVGVLSGDFVEGYLKKRLPEGSVTGLKSYDFIMGALRVGRLKVFAADTPTALFHLKKAGLDDKFVYSLPNPLYQNSWFTAAGEGNRELIKIINAGMSQVTRKERRNIGQYWTKAEAKEGRETLVIAIDRYYPPLSLVGPDGKPSGLLVEIWELWSKTTGNPIKFRPSDWNGTLEAMRIGEADIHSGLFQNEQRKSWLNFSRPLQEVVTAAYFQPGGRGPRPLAALRGSSVGTVAGSFQEGYIRKQYPDIQVKSYQNNSAMIIALLREEIEALVNEVPTVEADLNRFGLRGKLIRGRQNLFVNKIHAGVAKNNPELLRKVDEGLTALPIEELVELEARWLPNPDDHFFHRKEEREGVALTEEERTWLSKNPVWRVAGEDDWPPFNFVEGGQPKGLSIDIANMAAAKVGAKLEIVTGFTLTQLMEQFKAGELDIMPALFMTEERKQFLTYTEAYVSNPSVLVIHSDTSDIQELSHLKGKKIAVVETYATTQVLESRHPEIERVYVKNPQEGLKYVSERRVDAFIGSLSVISHLMEKSFIPNIHIIGDSGLKKREETRLHMAVAKNRPIFQRILQKGLDAISDVEKRRAIRRWIPYISDTLETFNRVNLTNKEQNWLARHPDIRLGVSPDWQPFEFFNEEGEYSGIGSGYVRIIENRLGIKLEPVADLSWSKVMEKAKVGEIDVLPAAVWTRESEKYLNFTRPYATFPIVIATHDDFPFVGELGDLSEYEIGVVRGYITEELLKRDFPALELIPFDSLAEGLKALSKKQVAAFVDALGTITYEMNRAGLTNIKFAAPTRYNLELAMAVRKDWPELTGILQKALATIDKKEKSVIKNTWMAVEVKFGLDFRTILLWAIPLTATAMLIIVFVMASNRRLGHEVAERKKVETQLLQKTAILEATFENMDQGISMIDADLKGVTFNKKFFSLLEFPEDYFTENSRLEDFFRYNAERGEYGPGDVEQQVQERIELARKFEPHQFERSRPDGTVMEIRGVPVPGGGMVTTYTDITERKQAQLLIAEKEAQLRTTVEGMPGSVFMVDSDLRIIVFNDRFREYYNFPKEKVFVGASMKDLLRIRAERGEYGPGDPDQLVDKRIMIYHQGKKQRFQDIVPATNRVLEAIWEPTIDGGMVVITTDITERIRAEEELGRKEAHLSTAMITMSDGFYITDKELRYVLFNDHYLELCDIDKSIVWVGRPIEEVTRIFAERGYYGEVDAAKITAERMKPQIRGEDNQVEMAVNNGERYLEFRNTALKEGGYVSVIRDITERKRAREALEEAYGVIKEQNKRMGDELNIGREIQLSMIPLTFPPFPEHNEFSIFAVVEPAREVGGDFYDFFFIDEERLCFCIGDVSGKGVPAALFMSVTKTLIKSRASDDPSTASILTHVNDELSRDNQSSMFVTVFLGIMNIRTGEVMYTNAGHNPPYIKRKDESLIKIDSRHGTVIGAVTGMVYKQEFDILEPGDMIFLYTDGVTEERNDARELFSDDRLEDILRRKEVDSDEIAIRTTISELRNFQGETEQEDDITMLAVQYFGDGGRGSKGDMHLVINNNLSKIVEVYQAFEKLAEKNSLAENEINTVKLIFDELLNNVISYGFPDKGDHEIDIKVEVTNNRLLGTISDEGIPFNPMAAPVPDINSPIKDRKKRGMGIHLVRSLVDNIFYQRRIDKNVTTFLISIDRAKTI